ncbi:NINE protein [Cellulosimicrobium sp. PMB13]|uniref:TM2 domain-containing protein n=1 Tax=Cellulosimicrobium sp. PMB13 TaxID=3120158 RepID=UPI003F4BA075
MSQNPYQQQPDPQEGTPYGAPAASEDQGGPAYGSPAPSSGTPPTQPLPQGYGQPVPQDPAYGPPAGQQAYSPQGQPGQPYGYPPQGQPGQPYGYPGGYGYDPNLDPNAKSRLAAGLLGIFLGSLGIHRFYLGYTGIGLTMLLVSIIGALPTFGLAPAAVSIWGLVEGILYLTAKQGSYAVDSTGRPLRA